MCEPNHSIVQYPDHDDDDNPTSERLDAIPPVGDADVWTKLKKRIGDFFHFSFMGLGHSETIGKITPFARHLLPEDTKYEAAWWNRGVHLDGLFHGKEYNEQFALSCAKDYANKVSIGNMTILRQFLTMSMRKSPRPENYIHQFNEMMNTKGKEQFWPKLRRILGIQRYGDIIKKDGDLDTVIKIMMGFTRKRGLLVPEWADDSKIWGSI